MQFHIVTKEIWVKAMILSRFFPCKVVDTIILLLCHLEFGSLAKYGIRRPANGPLYLKEHTPVYPVLDCGTVKKIKSGDIKVCGFFFCLCWILLIHVTTWIDQTLIPQLDALQVLPAIKHIDGNDVTFSDGRTQHFDAIVLATGYRSTVKRWLKVINVLALHTHEHCMHESIHVYYRLFTRWVQGDDCLIDEAGMAKQTHPNNWKGGNGLYCAGLARRGIYGSAEDALKIANDIGDDYKHTQWIGSIHLSIRKNMHLSIRRWRRWIWVSERVPGFLFCNGASSFIIKMLTFILHILIRRTLGVGL